MSKRSAVVRLLRTNASFRRLWAAQLVSLGGDWFNTVALLGLVLDLTGSALASGLVLAASILPGFLVAPIAGPMADRFNRRSLMIGSDVVRVFLALGMLLVDSPETTWIGIACLTGISTFGAIFYPASGASLPNLVADDELAAANTLMSASWGTMLAIGAALGGWVATYLGRDTAFIINAASFVFSALLIVRIKGNFSAPGTVKRESKTGFREGIAYARSDPRILALLATKGGFGLGVGVVALLPILATDVFKSGDQGIGLLFAARGLGALFGPFGAVKLVGTSNRKLLTALGWAMALYGLAYLAVSTSPALGLAAALAVIAHLGGGAQWVLSSYGLQRLAPDYVRGRILSMDLGLVSLTVGVSSVAAGRLADVYPPRLVMAGLALVELAYAAIWSLATRRIRRHADEEPSRGTAEPDLTSATAEGVP
jgi:MFS family permease